MVCHLCRSSLYIGILLVVYFCNSVISLSPADFLSLDKSESVGLHEIQCVLSDVDGTLTYGPLHSCVIADETVASIRSILKNGLSFYPCTGRTRSSMNQVTKGVVANIFGSIDKTPGVYQQGCMVFGSDGTLIWERHLSNEAVKGVVKFCDEMKVSVLAYCGEDIYRREKCDETDKVVTYDDPMPIDYPQGLDRLVEAGINTHKMIVMANDEVLVLLRPKLENTLQGIGSLTQAVPGMLEVLPYGSSKGDGVLRLLKYLDVCPSKTAAFGDGENDIEMFEAVRYSIAVANAKPKLKAVAKYITDSNAKNGVSKALDFIMRSK